MSNVLAAAGLIIYRGNSVSALRYLLLQTSYGEHHWTPPKGHVDPGEKLLETAIRETSEESGLSEKSLKIDITFKAIELRYVVKGRSKTVTYWIAEADDNVTVKLSDEHKDFKWCPIDEACSLVGFRDMQDALRKVHAYLCGKMT